MPIRRAIHSLIALALLLVAGHGLMLASDADAVMVSNGAETLLDLSSAPPARQATPTPTPRPASVADVSVVKIHVGDQFAVGTNGQYHIGVLSQSDVDVTEEITIVDTLPDGLTFVRVEGQWGCGRVGQLVSCTLDVPLPARRSNFFTLTVAVAPDAPASIVNTARLASPADANPDDNTASDTVLVTGGQLRIPVVPLLPTAPSNVTATEAGNAVRIAFESPYARNAAYVHNVLRNGTLIQRLRPDDIQTVRVGGREVYFFDDLGAQLDCSTRHHEYTMTASQGDGASAPTSPNSNVASIDLAGPCRLLVIPATELVIAAPAPAGPLKPFVYTSPDLPRVFTVIVCNVDADTEYTVFRNGEAMHGPLLARDDPVFVDDPDPPRQPNQAEGNCDDRADSDSMSRRANLFIRDPDQIPLCGSVENEYVAEARLGELTTRSDPISIRWNSPPCLGERVGGCITIETTEGTACAQGVNPPALFGQPCRGSNDCDAEHVCASSGNQCVPRCSDDECAQGGFECPYVALQPSLDGILAVHAATDAPGENVPRRNTLMVDLEAR